MTYNESQYLKLLEILYHVIETMRGEPLDPDGLYYRAEGLATKLWVHAASAVYLARGTYLSEFPPKGVDFVDFASVVVLARAAWECFLALSYIFVLPKSEEERDLRYLSYQIRGLRDTLLFPARSPEGQEVQRRSRNQLAELCAKLESNTLFQELKQEKKKRNLLKGFWKPSHWSWSRIGLESGISKMWATHSYKLLCAYAHPTEKSVLAIKQAETREEQRQSLALAMGLVQMAMAYVIDAYCELFAGARGLLEADPEGRQLVRVWLEAGRRGVE